MRHVSACVFLLGAVAALAAADPPAAEKQKVERAFGTIEDPDGDCRFALTGDKLKLTMKGGKQYDYGDGLTNCPRTVREVKGDFVATVRAYAVLPEKAAAAKGEMAEAGAGLIVSSDKGEAWRSGMHDFRGKERHLMIIVPGSRGPAGLEIENPADGAYVRFNRKDDSLALSVSGDGAAWTAVMTQDLKIGESARVGVYGFSNAKHDTIVYLDKFSIEPLKKGK